MEQGLAYGHAASQWQSWDQNPKILKLGLVLQSLLQASPSAAQAQPLPGVSFRYCRVWCSLNIPAARISEQASWALSARSAWQA